MQLGELQSQYPRFEARGASVIALSVDAPQHSKRMVRRLGLTFPVVSDADQQTMATYRVINPDTEELALHAVYVVDQDRQVFYRKVASRRPLAQELLDAIDHHDGNYPLKDESLARGSIPVAFPRNNFQALIEVAGNAALPATIDKGLFVPVLSSLKAGDSDAATIAYKAVAKELSKDYSEADLLAAAAWFAQEVVGLSNDAALTGRALNQALIRQRLIREGNSDENVDELEAELDVLRTKIRESADEWQLRRLKTSLRAYRELSFAALAERGKN